MKSFSSKLVTKVCLDPHCEAVIHRMPKGDPVCIDCGRKAVEINNDTFQKKFAGSFFQYDYLSGQYYRPAVIPG